MKEQVRTKNDNTETPFPAFKFSFIFMYHGLRDKLINYTLSKKLDHPQTNEVIGHRLKKAVIHSFKHSMDALQKNVIANLHLLSSKEYPITVQNYGLSHF